MILPFKTSINGKPTNFVEKIIVGLYRNGIIDDLAGRIAVKKYFDFIKKPIPELCLYKSIPKIHTIREDKHERWKVGNIIDFYINNRTKQAFRFAPRIPVVNVQEIKIYWFGNSRELIFSKTSNKYDNVEVVIDNKSLSIKEIERLVMNDGFDNVADFFSYFNEDFKGKIIHWTKINY